MAFEGTTTATTQPARPAAVPEGVPNGVNRPRTSHLREQLRTVGPLDEKLRLHDGRQAGRLRYSGILGQALRVGEDGLSRWKPRIRIDSDRGAPDILYRSRNPFFSWRTRCEGARGRRQHGSCFVCACVVLRVALSFCIARRYESRGLFVTCSSNFCSGPSWASESLDHAGGLRTTSHNSALICRFRIQSYYQAPGIRLSCLGNERHTRRLSARSPNNTFTSPRRSVK